MKWIKGFLYPSLKDGGGSADMALILHTITLWGIPLLLLIVVVRILSGNDQIDATHIFIGIVILLFWLEGSRFDWGIFRQPAGQYLSWHGWV